MMHHPPVPSATSFSDLCRSGSKAVALQAPFFLACQCPSLPDPAAVLFPAVSPVRAIGGDVSLTGSVFGLCGWCWRL